MVSSKGLLNEMIAHSVEHFAWNMMFHGAPFNCNYLILCIIEG